MKPGLNIGQLGELTWVVDPTMTITLGSLPQATVFSTPNMIMLMERAAREALRPFLEDGEESVGIEVQVEHPGPAALGDTVRGVARVTAVDGRRVSFTVQAFAGEREIGRGTHRRAIVLLSKIVENVAKVCGDGGRALTLEPNRGELPALETIRVKAANRIATVTLSRPRSLNAVNVQMTSDLEQVVAWLAGHPEEIRVVILTGADDAFCAGDDVIELPSLSIEEARRLSLRQANVYLAFERLPQPIIAAVNGAAFGAGCVAAYSCDLRLASHAAKFAMPEIKLGWAPGYGIAQLTALVGKARALELCLGGEPISATQALEWGLINELVPGVMLMQRARQLAERLLQLPATALRETKRLIHADEGQLPKVTHRADTEAYIRCLELPDAKEGIAAFAEKRKPRFTDK
ncbi:MAG TPA: enoyl-CoA hydratase-related protein [Verrucomicrobiae bacterium]